MARVEVVMPQMGESITTGTITKWNKNVGDTIEIDEILLEISTDKVESEIPSPTEGKIAEILYPEGDTIDVGKLIAVIEDDMSADISASSSAPAVKTEAKADAPVAVAAASAPQEDTSGERRFYTPLVKKLATDAGVALSELKTISGSGAGGRVNRADFEAYLSTRGSAPKAAASNSGSSVQLSTVPAYSASERVEIVPMDNMRKAIAKNMQASKLTSPHVNSIVDIDMTNLVSIRNEIKGKFKAEEGFNLTYSHFVMYALVQALKEFPTVNASIDGDNIVYKKDINLGCAVAVPGNGLIVPVIKGADNLNLTGIARQLNDLALKARNKKLTMDDLSKGTYTFTNNGSFGVIAATPVILQPQVGIFCVGTIKKSVEVMPDNSMAIRDIMYATHTYDHRLIDGEVGSKFLMHVKSTLENMDPRDLL
ncbi:MAG: 2-oxoglutarate dehydrogenase E2 component (dihydrolipoamide succinyltransferase) [Bacteriovoracaceae bacterium]|jgi:pyruvate dehydrogenase E2 component (dihydrolipoamide acetyltransferase)